MVIYHFFLLVINILFFQDASSKDIISIPFNKELPNLNNISPNDIFQKIKDNKLLAEISVGTPKQNMKFQLILTEYLFYLGGKNSLCQNKFIENESKSYQKISDNILSFQMANLKEGYFSSDIFYFGEKSEENKEINFILAIDTEQSTSSGIIGLNIQDTDTKKYDKYNFIKILKNNGIIKDYYFTIKYTNNNSGKLIIGDLPHNYDDKYDAKYFSDTYISMFENVLTWNINIESIYVAENALSKNKKIIGEKIYGYFKLESGIILGTERYRQNLLSDFMKEKINKGLCFEISNTFYISYYCKKEVDISKINKLYFYIKSMDYVFEFTHEDLFYKSDDGNNYFLVYFNDDYNSEEGSGYFWTFGEPFFKKYNLIFNPDTKRIGIYKSQNGENRDNLRNQSFGQRNKWLIILIVVLVIVCGGLGLMIYLYLKVLPKRKKKANELVDEFDYSSKDQNIINY